MKDIMGAALLGELLAALAKSSALRRSLGGVPPEDADATVRRMVSEVERVASEGATQAAIPVKQKPSLYPTRPPAPHPEEVARKPFPVPEVSVRPAPEPAPSASVPVVAPPPVPRPAPAITPAPAVTVPPVLKVTPEVVAQPASPVVVRPPAVDSRPFPAVPSVTPTPRAEMSRPAPPPIISTPDPVEPPVPEPPSPLRDPSARVQVPFDDETAFLLAASLIPLQEIPSPYPFGIGAEGVERGSEIFAFDHAGMRFFLSTLKSQEASVSRTGMVLLGKQESIKHRNAHEHLVNALRPQALVLPAEPGTVVFGRHDLVRRVDFRRDALFEVLLGLSTLSTWRVHAFVLDAHVQKMLPAEASPARAGRQDAERGRVPSASKKTDIKTLEQLLNRERKLAEAILQRLAGAADSHAIDAMVSLGSGSSEDWKPILKATFEVSPGRFTRFAETVVECEEANAMYEPMLSVVGGPGSFSLSM